MHLETSIFLFFPCFYFYKWYTLVTFASDLLLSFGMCLKSLISVRINIPACLTIYGIPRYKCTIAYSPSLLLLDT